MELQVGVKALLMNNEGKFLLVRRSADKYPEVGPKWDIVGGRINPGNSLIDNLSREIREETGLELIEEPKLVAAQDILRIAGRHVVRLTYIGKIEGIPKLDSDHTEYGWFTIEEMKAMRNLDIYFLELLEKGLIKP